MALARDSKGRITKAITEEAAPTEAPKDPAKVDNWRRDGLVNTYACYTCMFFCNFRCRRHATKGQEGWPAVYPTDWCGDHKMNKVTMQDLY